MEKLGVAVVGVGFWGQNHVRVFRELPETELIAVCDMNKETVLPFAEELGVEAYTDSEGLLKRKDVDAVSICTWTTAHAEEATKALKAGKHIFVEKPLASTIPEAKRIVKLAKDKERLLMVGFIERFNPGVQHVKELVDKGEIGVPVSATVRRVSQWPERIGDVGVVKDYAIHDVDIVRYIFGSDPVAVYAKVGRLRHKKFEDYAQIMLTFENDRTAFIESNWLTPYKVRKLIITGSRGITSLDFITQEVRIDSSKQTVMPRYPWKEPLKLELQHFANSVIHAKEPRVTGVDGLKALIITEAALQSAEKNETIKLKEKLRRVT